MPPEEPQLMPRLNLDKISVSSAPKPSQQRPSVDTFASPYQPRYHAIKSGPSGGQVVRGAQTARIPSSKPTKPSIPVVPNTTRRGSRGRHMVEARRVYQPRTGGRPAVQPTASATVTATAWGRQVTTRPISNATKPNVVQRLTSLNLKGAADNTGKPTTTVVKNN